MTPVTRVLVLAAAILAVVCSASLAPGADDGRGILRYDPLGEKLIPVPEQELKPGCIYSRYSARLDRRVWSFVQANGEFWYAFGPGTTQVARRFDMRISRRQAVEILEQKNPELAAALDRTDRPAYLRLDAEGHWQVARDDVTHATIYNAETGQRWEEICRNIQVPTGSRIRTQTRCRYIPVSSLFGGNRWVIREGRYVPASGGLGW